MRKKEGKIIWAAYFDSALPRDKGRRVPKSLSVEKPRLEEIARAAERAGFSVVSIDQDAKFPAFWFESGGRVIVKTTEKKSVVIKKIAEKLKELRGEIKKR